jgi:hypothetical protein
MRKHQQMARTPENIEASLEIPAEIAGPAMSKPKEQAAGRGDWSDPREARQPDSPWPDGDDPMLRYLLYKAHASLDAGMDPEVALLQLAVHAWFEGGVENYDRGQRDARRTRSM